MLNKLEDQELGQRFLQCREFEYPPVLTKKDFAERYSKGEFGNTTPTWTEPNDFLRWGCVTFGTGTSRGKFHLRNRVTAGTTYYNLDWSETVARWLEQENKGDWYVSRMAPTELTLFQGEVQQVEQGSNVGLNLYYSTLRLPMREALLKKGQYASGLYALSLLRYYLCPNSLDWLNVLLDRYPGHVVEFSTYGQDSSHWGTLPGFNTAYWECRLY